MPHRQMATHGKAAMTSDPHNLQRFMAAQHSVYERVCSELRAGRKTSHWIWFIFPQLRGLGTSPMSQQFAIGSRAEALAYLQHPLLGARLLECTQLVNAVDHAIDHAIDNKIEHIFGYPDDLKFHSCMTLFAQLTTPPSVFNTALEKYFAAASDQRTLELWANRQ